MAGLVVGISLGSGALFCKYVSDEKGARQPGRFFFSLPTLADWNLPPMRLATSYFGRPRFCPLVEVNPSLAHCYAQQQLIDLFLDVQFVLLVNASSLHPLERI